MRYEFRLAAGPILVALIVCGCANHRFTRLEDIGSNEALAIAKVRVLYNGKDKTKGCCIIFDAPPPNRYGYDLDETGYIFAKFPVGTTSIETILHGNGLTQRHFPPGDLACELKESGSIYYIGDITLDWRGMGSAGTWALVPAIGVIPTAMMGEKTGQIVVSVESHETEAQAAFRQKFPSDRKIFPSLLVVKPSQ